MRTVYEILKEVGLDHKDAVMIDFAYSQALNGVAAKNLGEITNQASEILTKKTGLYGTNGSAFCSYLTLQGRLDDKFPAGEPIPFYVPMTKLIAERISDVLNKHAAHYEQDAFQEAWENRRVI